MDILKASVEVRPCLQWRFRADGVDFFNQLREVVLYLIGWRTDLVFSGHIVVLLKFAGTLTVHDVAALIVSALRQCTVDGANQLNGQRLFCDDFVLQEVAAHLLVLLLEQGTGAAGVAHDLAVFKNFAGVVVVDLGILDLAGVVGKQNAEIIQSQSKVIHGVDVPVLPHFHNSVISAHDAPPAQE